MGMQNGVKWNGNVELEGTCVFLFKHLSIRYAIHINS